MDTYKTIRKRRSIRRFRDKEVPEELLEKCVDAGRLSPSGANLQPLKFITVTEKLEKTFECTNWAGYLEWEPTLNEMPRAYIVILKEKEKGHDLDAGIAAQSICLTARNQGVGSCILGALDFESLNDVLEVPEDHEIKLMVALGYPKKEPEVVEKSKDLEYYFEDDVLKVPKKSLEEVWIKR